MSIVVKLFAALLVVMVLIVAFYMFGLRTKNRIALTAIRRTNRVVFNPRQMKSAGTPGAYASIVEHTGRVSGALHRTPIVTREFDNDIIVLLPYGTQADWVKNVLAAGAATIVREGTRVQVSNPRLVSVDEVAGGVSPSDQRSNAMVGTVQALRLRPETTRKTKGNAEEAAR